MSNTQVLSPSTRHGTSAMVAALIMAVGMGFGDAGEKSYGQ